MNNIFEIALAFENSGLAVRTTLPRNEALDEPNTIDLMNGVIITLTNDFKYLTCITLDVIGTYEDDAGDTVTKMAHDFIGEFDNIAA